MNPTNIRRWRVLHSLERDEWSEQLASRADEDSNRLRPGHWQHHDRPGALRRAGRQSGAAAASTRCGSPSGSTDQLLDPVVGMTFAIARTERLKVGASVMVLPGRNPVLLAKTMASLDRLSNGRLLPAFRAGYRQRCRAPGVRRRAQGTRRLVQRGNAAACAGSGAKIPSPTTANVSISTTPSVNPKPVQEPLEVWMGGAAPLELRRVGRFSDGWLPSFSTPEDVKDGIESSTATPPTPDARSIPNTSGCWSATPTARSPTASWSSQRSVIPTATFAT